MTVRLDPIITIQPDQLLSIPTDTIHLAKIMQSDYRILDEGNIAFLVSLEEENHILLEEYGLHSSEFRTGNYLRGNCVYCGRTYERESGTIMYKDSFELYDRHTPLLPLDEEVTVSPHIKYICINCYNEINSVIERWIDANHDELVSHHL